MLVRRRSYSFWTRPASAPPAPASFDPLGRLSLHLFGPAVGLQLHTGGAVLHALIGCGGGSALASRAWASARPRSGRFGPCAGLLQLGTQCFGLLLRLFLLGGQRLPLGGKALGPVLGGGQFLLQLRPGFGALLKFPLEGLQLFLLLPAAAIDKVQHVLLLEASKGGGAELQLSGCSWRTPFLYKNRVYFITISRTVQSFLPIDWFGTQ